MNLALSLLYAAERTPDAEAVVDGDDPRHLRGAARAGGAARGRPRGEGVERGDRVAAVARNRAETVELFWACQWLGAVFVPLSHRLARGRPRVLRRGLGRAALPRPTATTSRRAGATDIRARSTWTSGPAIMLYTSGTTGRPKGVPRSHRAERAGGLSQVVQHGYATATARSA